MAILEKCSSCKREGGHAEKETDKICARCKRKKTQPRLEDPDNKMPEENNNKN